MKTETPVVLSGGTEISWAHFTHNPWWGCFHVSPACDSCYAETLAMRFADGLWEREGPRRFFGDTHLDKPLVWERRAVRNRTRYRVFCASMADVFEEREDLNPHRDRLWATIEATPHLDWMLLTKRPQHVNALVPERWMADGFPQHVWVGTTVENQRYADLRVPQLLAVPATIRFLSCEPLLGPVDLTPWLGFERGVDWVIVGGESGRNPRPMLVEWARSLRDQCITECVAFHFKQHGEWAPDGQLSADGSCAPLPDTRPLQDGMRRVGKRAAGRMLDGRTWDGFPT